MDPRVSKFIVIHIQTTEVFLIAEFLHKTSWYMDRKKQQQTRRLVTKIARFNENVFVWVFFYTEEFGDDR